MFEWLEDEMARIRTPKFHLVDGAASDELKEAVEASALAVPPSYRQFVVRFGNAKLYRQGGLYLVQVYAGPREERSSKGGTLIHFGRADLAPAYFQESLLVDGDESPVFESSGPRAGLRRTAAGFEKWLAKKCKAARRRFRAARWSSILKGPETFTEEEKAIVEARRCFRWRVVGIAGNGDIHFEVHNGSNMSLPYLTLGVRWKNGEVFGGIWLPVGHIGPGQTALVSKDCYREFLNPQDVEVFDEPDPQPEDREEYWEFRALDRCDSAIGFPGAP